MIGYVAYGIYKRNKIKHIEGFKAANNNNEPSEADLEPFHSISSSEDSIAGYRLRAEQILQSFTDEVLDNTISNIEADTLKNQTDNLEKIIKPIIPKSGFKAFCIEVLISALASFVVIVFFGIMLIVLYANDKGSKEIFETVTKTKIIPAEIPSKADTTKD